MFCKISGQQIALIILALALLSSLSFGQDGYEVLKAMKSGPRPAFDGTDQVDDETGYDVQYYDIEIEFDPVSELVDGRVDMTVRATEDGLSRIDFHLRFNLDIDLVQVDGVNATYTREGNYDLFVDLAQAINIDDEVTVSVEYNGDAGASGSMGGLHWHDHSGTALIASLSQPSGARWWWPCKDIPADKAPTRMVWTVPDWMTATGNGYLQSVTTPSAGLTSFEWIEEYPMSPYLVAVTATDFVYWREWWVTAEDDSLAMDYWVFPEHETAARNNFVDMHEMMDFFVGSLGEYPYMDEKYGHVEFNFGGAMEHQTLTSMGYYFVGFGSASSNSWIYAHELAHMWWGDEITCETWMDIWLNEAPATYWDALWQEHFFGPSAFNDRMNQYRNTYMNSEYDPDQGRFPIYDPEYLWGGCVYEKGAWIMHMLRWAVGDENFWNFYPELRNRYAYDAFNTVEMQETIEDVSGMDLDWFYDEWVYMAGFPEYEWGWTLEDIGNDSFRVDLSIIQTQPDSAQTPQVFIMPVEFKVTTLNDEDIYFTVWNDERSQNFSMNVYGLPIDLDFDPNRWILMTDANTGYVAVDEEITQPERFDLSLSVMPNPANPEAQISFNLPIQQQVKLAVYNLTGQKVATLMDGVRPVGMTQVTWRPANQASGVYIVHLETADQTLAKKLTILK